MDFSMPNCEGPEAARAIIAYLNDYPSVKKPYICCVSAYVSSKYKERAFAAGMDMFIVKPLLKDSIERILIAAKMKELPTTAIKP